jgi:Transposase/Transposase IS116/IS110/IS902 family
MHLPFVAVGIDSSDDHHDLCLLGPADAPEVRLRLKNTLADFQRLFDELERRFPGVACHFAIENPRNLLGRFLLLSGKPVFALNPLAVAHTRKGLAHSGAKSDELDAHVLASLLRTRGERRLKPLALNSPEGTLVAGLVAQRQELVGEKTRFQNQLTAALKGFYPRFLELFADLEAPIARAALKAFPSPTALAQATPAQWEALFGGARYPRPTQIASLWERAQAPQVPVEAVQEQLEQRQVLRLVRLLDVVIDELRQVEKALAEAFAAHPDADFFRSLPGAAEVLAPSLLALLGDDRKRWQDWRQIATYIGTAPITESSGKFRVVKMRFHCNRQARTVLHLYAQASRRKCAWAEEFYQKQRQAGRTHSGALRSLANKWLRILFRMWQDRKPYDEAAYLAALQRRQGPKPSSVSALAA